LDSAADEIRTALKDNKDITVKTLSIDLTSYADVVAKFRQLYATGPKIDWIIANAGSATPGYLGDQLDASNPVAENMMSQNYFTAVNVVRASMLISKELGDKAAKEASELAAKGERVRRRRPWEIIGFSAYQGDFLPSKIVLVGSTLSIMSFIGYSAYSAR
jgi:short-subunit dehydrogenase